MNIQVTTTQLIVTSAINKGLYEQAMDFNPNALKLKDEHGNETFRVKFEDKIGSASVSAAGATFSSVSEDGYLQAIITFDKQYASRERAIAAVRKDRGNALAALAEAEPIIAAQIAAATNRVTAVFEGV